MVDIPSQRGPTETAWIELEDPEKLPREIVNAFGEFVTAAAQDPWTLRRALFIGGSLASANKIVGDAGTILDPEDEKLQHARRIISDFLGQDVDFFVKYDEGTTAALRDESRKRARGASVSSGERRTQTLNIFLARVIAAQTLEYPADAAA